ncbi:single-stranded DNA binding protein [Haloarchaeobius sp. HME9146]|uniref:single-stranded DNA binding protein n=1 Tax=Haloarchaeobius sp. HME9146 TaxID=2978732 RepID=UPI0021BF2B11|nr:single-stranded DNA binding protein [Haloarchaeobius sp. HME9146]MCT9095262.1 single-stranded DNA binding protein [Haloarchaeobius sp. HME9146]
MGAIEDVYEDLDAEEVTLEEFREAVEAKVEQMGGLADDETAAMLIAHELEDKEVNGISDISPGMQEVKFIAKVTAIGETRTFERDGDDPDGKVANVEVADESGSVRLSFWDEQADAAENELEVGQVLRIKGRPKEGYNGIEVSVDEVEVDDDAEVDVEILDAYRIEDLSLGLSDVNLKGRILDTESIRTFDRDDGSEGKVANMVLGDPTGRIRVTMWDGQADTVEAVEAGMTVEVVDGYVRERDGQLELHVGERGAIEELDEDITYEPESTPIADLELGQTVDISGVIRSADPKRTFDRDDGSEGQVRNVRVQDDTDDIRVALWGDKADYDLGPGDRAAFADVEIQEGWQDDLEASAGWRSSVTVLDDDADTSSSASADAGGGDEADQATGLGAFSGDEGASESGASGGGTETETASASGGATASLQEEAVEFTGTVVQAGSPVILDNGEETMSVETDADVHLGQEVTARGSVSDGVLDADDVF